jgi:hypothetical protein
VPHNCWIFHWAKRERYLLFFICLKVLCFRRRTRTDRRYQVLSQWNKQLIKVSRLETDTFILTRRLVSAFIPWFL